MTAPPARGRPDRPRTLWRQPNFRNYALGQGISVAGSGVTLVAVPVVAALKLHASTLQVAGLVVAGRLPPLLVALLGGGRAIAADSLSYLLSAVLLMRITTPEPARTEPKQSTSMLADIRAGLADTLRTPLVRAAVLSDCVNASVMAACAALWSLFLLRTLGWPPTVLGLVMGAGGIGGVIGGITDRRLAARFGRVIVTALAMSPVCQLPLLLARPGVTGRIALLFALVSALGLVGMAVVTDTPSDGHRVVVQTDPAVPLADAGLLRRAVANLLGNALPHGHPPEQPADSEITLDADSTVTVDDAGPGIPPERARSLFERFHSGAGSTGLGLS
ncbi:ATP-binding protein, partial [Kitasatospora sp. NPDC101155]|uniref:ATP-binding protein n=1 Tax=Kitasatospora sp. NPDC101155 TaxID=3364097 RepID=UPI003820597E